MCVGFTEMLTFMCWKMFLKFVKWIIKISRISSSTQCLIKRTTQHICLLLRLNIKICVTLDQPERGGYLLAWFSWSPGHQVHVLPALPPWWFTLAPSVCVHPARDGDAACLSSSDTPTTLTRFMRLDSLSWGYSTIPKQDLKIMKKCSHCMKNYTFLQRKWLPRKYQKQIRICNGQQ